MASLLPRLARASDIHNGKDLVPSNKAWYEELRSTAALSVVRMHVCEQTASWKPPHESDLRVIARATHGKA